MPPEVPQHRRVDRTRSRESAPLFSPTARRVVGTLAATVTGVASVCGAAWAVADDPVAPRVQGSHGDAAPVRANAVYHSLAEASTRAEAETEPSTQALPEPAEAVEPEITVPEFGAPVRARAATRHDKRYTFTSAAKAVDRFGAQPLEQIPAQAVTAYQRAATAINEASPTCGLDWMMLAAVGRVESDHGRVGDSRLGPDGVSSPPVVGRRMNGVNGRVKQRDSDGGKSDDDKAWDRRIGPMQVTPAQWTQASVDGDGDGVRDPHDIDDAALFVAVTMCAAVEAPAASSGLSARARARAARAVRSELPDGAKWLEDRDNLRSALRAVNEAARYPQMVLRAWDAYLAETEALAQSALDVVPVSTDTPTDTPADTPTESPDNPSDEPTDVLADEPTDGPNHDVTHGAGDDATGTPAQPTHASPQTPTGTPNPPVTPTPSEPPTEPPTEAPTEAPAPTETPEEAPSPAPATTPSPEPTVPPVSAPAAGEEGGAAQDAGGRQEDAEPLEECSSPGDDPDASTNDAHCEADSAASEAQDDVAEPETAEAEAAETDADAVVAAE